MNNQETKFELSIILPCRNEEKALADCLNQIKSVLVQHNINGEIIVSDSSTDSSPQIAKELGVKLVKHDKIGYGWAYLEGFKVAQGKYFFMADADGTYDFTQIPKFLELLKQGNDLVIGNRFKGEIAKKAMPFWHRYFGNPILSAILRLLFKVKVSDAHCGIRAITKESLLKLNLKTTGMEFASEMIIAAGREKLKIVQTPTNYYQRKGESKLKSLPDGWRHLRFMLMYAPNYLFLIPGTVFLLIGLSLIFLLKNNVVYACFVFILGFQIISLGIFTKTYMKSAGFIKNDKVVDSIAKFLQFETGIFLGFILILFSFLLSQKFIFNAMVQSLNLPAHSLIILALTLAVVGIQTSFSAFLISILLVAKK